MAEKSSKVGAHPMPSGVELVELRGEAIVPLVRAVAALAIAGLARYAIVGGVAVTARLGQAHRATADIDAVVDQSTPPDAVEALLRLPGATADPSAIHRVLVDGTKIEILGVEPLDDQDLQGIPDKDALFVAAHAWALDTATPLTLVASAVRATAPVASPAALVAMKLHAIEDRSPSRGQDKRAGDAWDIYRLLLDRDARGEIRRDMGGASPALRRLVAQAADRVLVRGVARTRSWLAAGDASMASVTADELRFVGERFVTSLAN
ncbi:MAG: nucleotidyl transferase AbiEii/AbiGii toxin family protein [Nitrososphaerales archaeon]